MKSAMVLLGLFLSGGTAWAQAGVCKECENFRGVTKVVVASADAWDGLAEVNAQRAQRGLPPYQRDDALTQAAGNAARFRAAHRISGHTANDFTALPSGAHADAAGCAVWPVGMGFGACAMYDRYAFAGAAYVVVGDQRYMHLFVSNRPNGPVTKAVGAAKAAIQAVTHPVQTVQATVQPCGTASGPDFGWRLRAVFRRCR